MQWLDFDGRRLQGARPFSVWQWRAGDEDSRGDALENLRAAWQVARNAFPRGGLIGYFAYDFARTLEPRAFVHNLPRNEDVPLARWTFYKELISTEIPAEEQSISTVLADVTPNENDAEYEASVARILEFIAAGDIYQANLTRRFAAALKHTPRELYARLQAAPMPMSALLEYNDFALVSHSPERFWKLQNGVVTAQPIKGTRARGATAKHDEAMQHELETSAKDRAENVMIVDLLRNDLGRVCEYGSVEVPQLFQACAFPTVWHGVSTVTGKLKAEHDVFDLLRASFPCGSISGAPKIRAMQIIDELEPVPRGASMGAIGWIDFAGNADFNVAIRTATYAQNRISFHAGGGIVADSEAASERLEIETKTRALRAALAA